MKNSNYHWLSIVIVDGLFSILTAISFPMVSFDCIQQVIVVVEEHEGPDQCKSTSDARCYYDRSALLERRRSNQSLPIAVMVKVLSGLLKTLTSVESRPMMAFRSAGLPACQIFEDWSDAPVPTAALY